MALVGQRMLLTVKELRLRLMRWYLKRGRGRDSARRNRAARRGTRRGRQNAKGLRVEACAGEARGNAKVFLLHDILRGRLLLPVATARAPSCPLQLAAPVRMSGCRRYVMPPLAANAARKGDARTGHGVGLPTRKGDAALGAGCVRWPWLRLRARLHACPRLGP